MEEIWTVLLNKSLNSKEETLSFYKDDLFKKISDFNPETDWRTKAVKGVRPQVEVLGIVKLKKEDWPINFPLKLESGEIIKEVKISYNNYIKE